MEARTSLAPLGVATGLAGRGGRLSYRYALNAHKILTPSFSVSSVSLWFNPRCAARGIDAAASLTYDRFAPRDNSRSERGAE